MDLNKRLNSYGYGVPVNGQLVELDGPEFANAYRTMSVPEFEKYKGGVCWDYARYQHMYLQYRGIRNQNFYIELHDKMSSTHTFTVVMMDGFGIYIESSFRKIQGVYISTSLDYIVSYILKNMTDHVSDFELREYKDPRSGRTTLEFMDWCIHRGKPIRIKYVETRTIDRGEYKEIVEV